MVLVLDFFINGCFEYVPKLLSHWPIRRMFPLICRNKLIGDLNEMISLSIAFASKALLNLSNVLVYSLLVRDDSINFEAFFPGILLHLT